MNKTSACVTLKVRRGRGGSIRKKNNKYNSKTVFYIIIALALLFLGNGIVLGALIPSILLLIALSHLNAIRSFTQITSKNIPKFYIIIWAFISILFTTLAAKACIIQITSVNNFTFSPKKTIGQILKSSFDKYNTHLYEEIDDISERACLMEIRFTYILTALDKIEETNKNIGQRSENLEERDKNLRKNINKINKRAKNAKIPLLALDIPSINIDKVPLEGSYNRISIWNDNIVQNVEKPNCSTKCAFNHIDQSSVNIVYEIDEIHTKQNNTNAQLTTLEQIYDKLEEVQRQKEMQLTLAGF